MSNYKKLPVSMQLPWWSYMSVQSHMKNNRMRWKTTCIFLVLSKTHTASNNSKPAVIAQTDEHRFGVCLCFLWVENDSSKTSIFFQSEPTSFFCLLSSCCMPFVSRWFTCIPSNLASAAHIGSLLAVCVKDRGVWNCVCLGLCWLRNFSQSDVVSVE